MDKKTCIMCKKEYKGKNEKGLWEINGKKYDICPKCLKNPPKPENVQKTIDALNLAVT